MYFTIFLILDTLQFFDLQKFDLFADFVAFASKIDFKMFLMIDVLILNFKIFCEERPFLIKIQIKYRSNFQKAKHFKSNYKMDDSISKFQICHEKMLF